MSNKSPYFKTLARPFNNNNIQEGEINLESLNKTISWFRFNNGYHVDTVMIGDSILRNVIINGAVTMSISGGRVADYMNWEVLNILQTYRNVIIGSLGGNDLTNRQGVQLQTPQQIVERLELLQATLQQAGCSVFLATVCPRFERHNNHPRIDITNLNALVMSSRSFKYVNQSKFVYLRQRDFNNDGVHLTRVGKRNFCPGIKKLRTQFAVLPNLITQ